MIQVNNLSKGYAKQNLLEKITFQVGKGEKIGLVGRNGHGKTTLFRMIIGEETPDEGEISIPKNYRIGYQEQRLHFTQHTILRECAQALPPDHSADLWKVEKILVGLGFEMSDMERSPLEFSGGFQVRLNLTKLLLSEPDMLLLDEPTNYLDILAIRWLKGFLQEWKSEFILITHDREFMDDVVTHTIAIHRTRVRKLDGNTEKMYFQLANEEEIYEKTRLNEDKERKRIEQFVNRFKAKAKLASRVQSRVKKLERMDKRERLAEIKDLDFAFSFTPLAGRWAFEAQGISFSYDGGKPYLIDKLEISVEKTDRVAIIGRNGKGKSTLIRMLAGELEPIEGGVRYPPNVRIGYFGQTNRETLTPHLTVEEEIYKSMEEPSRERARGIAGAMLFEGDFSQKLVSVLSGGEKARLLLGKILAAPTNLLLLDEPTNHLDMQASDALLEALDDYDGGCIIVTHNEMFLNALPNRLIVFDENRAFVFEGTYQEFLENVGWAEEREAAGAKKSSQLQTLTPKEQRKLRAEIVDAKTKTLGPLKSKIAECEESIAALESNIARNNRLLVEASTLGKSSEIVRLSIQLKDDNQMLEKQYSDWDKTNREYERLQTEFEKRLTEVG